MTSLPDLQSVGCAQAEGVSSFAFCLFSACTGLSSSQLPQCLEKYEDRRSASSCGSGERSENKGSTRPTPILASTYYQTDNMFAYNATLAYTILQPYPSAVHLYSTLYLTSTSCPLGLPINKAPSPKTYRLKRFTTKRSSPHHDGESFSVPTNYTPCPNFLIHFLAMKFSSISKDHTTSILCHA